MTGAGHMSDCHCLDSVFECVLKFQGGTSSGRRTTQMHSGTGDPMCAGQQVGACGMRKFESAEVAK
jgi:hypothetical protein